MAVDKIPLRSSTGAPAAVATDRQADGSQRIVTHNDEFRQIRLVLEQILIVQMEMLEAIRLLQKS